MAHTDRLGSWIDDEGLKNKALEEAITEDANTFEVFRNTTNDGFESDGDLASIGKIEGNLTQNDKGNLVIITNTQLVLINDVLENFDTQYKVIATNKSEESDAMRLEVIRL